MNELISIGWFIWILVSVYLIFVFVGYVRLVQMFPEGMNWWDYPVQLLCILHFAIAVLMHPF